MIFNEHLDLAGKHAFLSASQYHWVNYTDEKLEATYHNKLKALEGTELHELASQLIKKRIKVHPYKKAFNLFINDAIGYGMESEVVLYYSPYCFGTADAILFDHELNLLRIHDLKTGSLPTKFIQLDIYAAFFCLEYGMKPNKINIEQRLYQGNEVRVQTPDPKNIAMLMKKIVDFSRKLELLDS